MWLRAPARALRLLARDVANGGRGEPESLSLYSWLALTVQRDETGAERTARLALDRAGDGRFASAALAAVLLNRAAYDEALEVLRAARARHPSVPWYELSLADALVEAGREGRGAEPARAGGRRRPAAAAPRAQAPLAPVAGGRRRARPRGAGSGSCSGSRPTTSCTPRTTSPPGRLELEAGDREAAHEVWRRGSGIYPRHDELRKLLAEHFDDAGSADPPRIARVSEQAVGAHRIPVRTPFITARTGLDRVIDEATAELRQPGDVLVLAESAAAAGQGKIVPLELVEAGALARVLSRFVGKIGPLHSPEGMEGAILECGRARVIAGGRRRAPRARPWAAAAGSTAWPARRRR